MRFLSFIFLFFHFALIGEENFLLLLVDAPHLDCSSNHTLVQTIAKRGNIGHAWIYLQGVLDGQAVFLEGGHSGELGISQPRYFDGVMDYLERGDANPIRYLWSTQQDGFFQKGNGNHRPTYAVRIEITQEQFHKILEFVQTYDYKRYSLTGNQCATFVVQVAALTGFSINCLQSIPIQQYVYMHGERFRLWQDPRYSMLTISSPDRIESWMKAVVQDGRVNDALEWYRVRK